MNKLQMKYKIIIGLIITVCAGFLGEFIFNLPLILSSTNRVVESLELQDLETTGFVLVDGALVATETSPSISFRVESQYIDKLRYEYDFDNSLEASIQVTKKDYQDNETTIQIGDSNNIIYVESIVNVRQNAEQIDILFQEESEGLVIRSISIDNTGNFSPVRFLFVCSIIFILLFLILAKDIIKEKFEIGYVVIALIVGSVMIIAMPLHKVGWDEDTHFERASSLSYKIVGQGEMHISSAISNLMAVSLPNWPYHIPQSEEEYRQELHYLNTSGIYSKDSLSEEEVLPTSALQLSSIGCIPQTIMLLIGRIIGLPFAYIYMLGRFGNLFFYCIVTFFAVRHMKVGKRIMGTIALMPTPLFLATVYSYDATVIACMLLGISYLLTEFINKEEFISYKNYAVFVGAMIIACSPKAVYIPLILLGIFLPNSKFKTKKEMYIMKGGILFVFFGMLSTFMLPVLTRSNIEGDLRGGATSVSGQLRYIFSNPVAYAKLLLKQIKDTFWDYILGSPVIGYMGHLKASTCTMLSTVLLVFVTITDRTKENTEILSAKIKIVVGVLVFATISLIWTALYLSYTPVAAQTIGGVQGRYYIPFLVFIFLIFNSDKFSNKMSVRRYNTLLLAISAIILFVTTYNTYIIAHF